ncbi:hypothetical protein L7F22_033588 [Adiantum nelumboides]|nr:hypothetical protein [Adiantum nelumboides]
MLVGSLLLHLTRLAISLLFRKPAPSRRKRRLGPVPAVREAMGSTDESDDELGEYSTLQAECYEDCEGEDISHTLEQRYQWLAEKRSETENYEWEDNWTSESDGVDAEDGDDQYEDVEDTWQEAVGDGEDEARDAWPHAGVGNTNYSAHKVGAADTNYMGGAGKEVGDENSRKNDVGDTLHKVGDGVQELVSELADEEEVGDNLERQRSMSFPSDLPPTLDNVIIAAAVNNHAEGAASEGAGRPLAPTFSSVAAALQESSASSARKPVADHQPTDVAAAGLPIRTSSYSKFVAKFNEHFMRGDDD